VYTKLFRIFLENKDTETFIADELFKNEDPEISKAAIDLTFDIDKYKISERWLEKYDIFIVTPDISYKNNIDKTYAQFKICKVGEHYKNIAKQFEEIKELPEEERTKREIELQQMQKSLKIIEGQLAEITGTTVAR